ncbi:MAG: Ig-like domain-containing protein, partial [Pseudomonadota bacterium]
MSDSQASIVAQWNEVALAAIREEKPFPTVITRALHIAHSAMYDAWAAYDADAVGAYSSLEAEGSASDIETAVSLAAFTALMEVLPDRQYMFREFLDELGLTDATSEAAQVGVAAAEAVISARAFDGSNWADDYEDTSGYEAFNDDDPEAFFDPEFDVNKWTPLRVPNGTVRDEDGIPVATLNPATYDVQKPITPHWTGVTPFAIEDVETYRPDAPPKLGDFSTYIDGNGKVTTGDAAFREQFGNLVDISANLTAEHKAIAEYWADGPQTSTPPGHWNEIAHDLSAREGYGVEDDVKMFFALNNALFDTGIAIWDAKYAYDFVRPQTAIQYLYYDEQIESWAGPNKGTQTISGSSWQPYQDVTFVTPAFPEYTSGHSGFSFAAATVLSSYVGTDTYFDGESRGAYDLDGDGELDLIGTWTTDELAFEDYDGDPITLSWNTLWDAAAEAGSSRLYGGIHIQDGDLRAREAGAAVAEDVWAYTSALFEQDADNLFDVSGDTEFLTLGGGNDEVTGTTEELDGLRIADFEAGDKIRIEGLTLRPDQLGVREGSAILEIDEDRDGEIDSEIVLEGDFKDSQFVVLSSKGSAEVGLADDSAVSLTEADERFITSDIRGNAVTAGAGTDFVLAGAGNDVIDGDEGDDVLSGGADDDVLIGGEGTDVHIGGAGSDIFAMSIDDVPDGSTGPVADIIRDFAPGEDVIEIAGYEIGFDDLNFAPVEGGVAVLLPGSRFIVLEGLTDASELSASDFSFVADGRDVVITDPVPQRLTDANDRYVSAGDFADNVDGLGGNDAIVTSGLADVIAGGPGDDVINAGAGDDDINSGGGLDIVTSGAGNDTIRFNFADDEGNATANDEITDYVAGQDTYIFDGYPGIVGLDSATFVAVETGLAMILGNGRFVVFRGLSNRDELNEDDFEFTGAGEVEFGDAALADDTGASDSDGLTNDPTVAGDLVTDTADPQLEVQFAEGGEFFDVTDAVEDDGSFSLTRAVLEAALGETLDDGEYALTLRASNAVGSEAEIAVAFTLDATAPTLVLAPGDDSEGVLDTGPDILDLTFDEAVSDTALAAGNFTLTLEDGTAPEITSVDRLSETSIRLNLAATLTDGAYTLDVAGVEDVAGNEVAQTDVDFTVDGLTTVLGSSPNDGGERINLDRPIVIEFDRAVKEDSITSDSIKLMASGEQLAGRLDLSSNGKIATFFPDEVLPSSTNVRLLVDGDLVMGADGKQVDADGDGEAGGMYQADFATASLTRVANTNIEGFIFDANYTDDDGLDIPLEGVVVKVVGLPGVETVTDENGRFFLEDMPIPQVYLDFDASNVVNRDEFDYGTIVKPVDTVAGQTVGLSSGEKAFNIYFAALAEGDVVELVEGEETEVGIGEVGLANLEEVFPNIDTDEWEKLKVIVPADSLTRDDGSLVEEVTIMAFPPERIPAPLPEGFDPTFVFTVKAEDATNVDGNAQIELPNVDGLPLGAKRPILSFDHDAGEWVQSGTAIVVEDGQGGTVLRSEGDSGVNTLGWKAVGPDPTIPVNDDPKSHDDLGIGNKGFESFRQNVSAQLSAASLVVGFIDTAESGADVVIPDGPLLTPIDLGLTLISGGLGALSDVVGTGEVGVETVAGIELSLLGDLSNAGEVPFEVAGTIATASSNALGIKGLIDANKRALDANKNFGNSLVEWAEMFGNDVSDFLSDRKRDFDNAVDGVQDFIGDTYQKASDAVDAVSRGLDTLGKVMDGFNAARRYFDNFNNPIPFLNGDGTNEPLARNEDPDAPPTSEEVVAIIAEAQASIAQFIEDFPGQTIGQVFDQARADLNESTDDFNAATGLALEGGGRVLYAVEFESGVVLRGASENGDVDLQLPPNEIVVISYFAPDTGFVTQVRLNTADLLGQPNLNTLIFDRDLIDEDEDELGSIAEFVIGTSDSNPDSDDDGILDGAEVEQGLNPLDGIGFPTGIIGALSLSGEAVDITVEGSLLDTLGQTAYIATGSHGLAIVDASNFTTPILLAQLELAGDNQAVSVDTLRGLAFVAGGNSGLHIVDISDGAAPELVDTVGFPGGIKSVQSVGGALIAGGSDLYILNPASGDVLLEAGIDGTINDIAVDGDTIYAIVDQSRLVSFNFNGQTLVELDSTTFPTGTIATVPDDKQIFIANDVAYIANGLEVSNVPLFRLLERGGYLTYDVADPSAMELISNIDTPRVQAGNLETITNGAGLALVAGGFRGLQVHDASDPENTYDLIAEFATPGSAESVALASGIAYVADGSGGLQVINFLPFDADGQAPEVSFDSNASDADPDTDGVQVEEGTRIELDVTITDDVQVRNVELLLDGQVVANDVSAPFDLSFIVPALSDGAETIEVAVRATDTGGNATTTDTVTFNIIPDITPPEVIAVAPDDGQLVLVGETSFTIVLNEGIDTETVSLNNFSATLDDGGAPIAPIDIAFLGDDNIVRVTFPTLPLGVYTVSLDVSGITDRAGNAIDFDPLTQSFEVVDATAVWAQDSVGGRWDDATKWRDGVVPTADDGVAMVLDETVDVDIFQSARVKALRLAGDLELRSGTFTVDALDGSSGSFTQFGGILQNSTLDGEAEFDIRVTSGVWTRVDLLSSAVVGGSSSGSLTLRDGFSVDGSLEIDGSGFTSRVFVEGSETLEGSGRVVLDGSAATL